MPLDFTQPARLAEIIDRLSAKTPIGSAMRTAEWGLVAQALRDAAFFSAGVESVRYLQTAKARLRSIIDRSKSVNENGESYWTQDRSRLIAELRQLGERLGLKKPGAADDEPRRETDIADPISVARLKLVVNTQMEMAYGHADYQTSQDPVILNEWPAWELVRITPRRVPRDWITRWKEAGGETPGGRMIALKTSPVWVKISRFGNPWPPFDFNSGMGVEEIGRDEAEELGLVKAGEQMEPGAASFTENMRAEISGLDAAGVKQLKRLLGKNIAIKDGEAKWKAAK